MVNITSTTRPSTISNGSNNTSSDKTSTGGIAEEASLTLANTNPEAKTNYTTPTINQFNTSSIRQQAIKPETINDRKPEVVYENRYLNKVTTAPNLTTNDRSDLSILNKWANRIKASNNASNVTTYMDDPTTVPLTRRDTNGFFNVDYNNDGTYHVTTTGIKLPFTDTVVGNYDLGNVSWNPIQAYSVASPIGIYLGNFSHYDTKNKIVQGTLALSNAYSNYYNGTNNFVDDYAIKDWGNLVDMSVNWKDRNMMQNAVSGLSTITGLSTRYGYNEYLGGDGVVGGVNDVLAMYTFGNSIYNLGKYWDNMSVGQKVGATLSTINAGQQAYKGLDAMSTMYTKLSSYINSAGAGAGAGVKIISAQPTNTSGTTVPTGESGSASTLGTSLNAAAALYTNYEFGKSMGMNDKQSLIALFGPPLATQAIYGFCNNGRGTADDRKAGAASGASAGATLGAFFGPAGSAIGALVGATIGTISQSGKYGRSREQFHRSLYRDSLTNAGIFERFDKVDRDEIDHGGKTFYQLADGSYYNVGADGSGSRAKDINGNVKKFYNPDLIEERDKTRDSGEMSPYNIDYTCNMDFTGSLLLAPLNALGLGGSNTRDSGEYGQMLGYMTNAVTSNVGREFTKENFNKMVDNVKAGYERVGITNKMDAMESIGMAYMMGKLTDDDYNSYKLALNMLYDNSGYNQAQTLMDQLNRGEQAQSDPITISSDNVGAESNENETLIEKESVDITPQETEVKEQVTEEAAQ